MPRIITLTLILALSACRQADDRSPSGASFEVDPFWPMPLPNHWMLGEVAGVSVDKTDHIWILQRRILTDRESGADQDTVKSECCAAAPALIEFDPDGNVLRSWGPDSTGQWFTSEHGLLIDDNGNVWVSGNNVKDDVVIKFTADGKRLLQIGEWGVSKGSNDSTHLGGPAGIAVDVAANEVYIADGYRNRRVIVFDATTGEYKRHWGGYGEKPDDSPLPAYAAGEQPIRSFRNPHSVRLSADGLVYVCDRTNNRIQVFRKDGTFVSEGFLARNTLGPGAVWDISFSSDAAQTYLYIADGMNMKVWILDRATLEITGSFGQGGRNAGQFSWVHNTATDSRGNLYTVEVSPGKRVQKFKPK